MNHPTDVLDPTLKELFGDVRVQDLIAKTAGVSLKDTIRVLLSVYAVGTHFDMTIGEMLPPALNFDMSRPTSKNVAACEQAFADLQDGRVGNVLASIQKYK